MLECLGRFGKAFTSSFSKYAKVGFNRKIGILRSDGVEVVPVEYKNIKVINEHYGVLMAIYKSVDLWLNNTKFS